MKTFKGLSLQPVDAFRNIAAIIEVGLLISITDKDDGSDLGDCIFQQAKLYAEAAADHALENQK
ncbi:hypothetical protein [Phytobacter sp. MRY16-398]|uniref:hypothetical protein n=1 Tax=Phytobacter sp. MRY16-398 TaxID=2487150 RepID=UPI000DF5C50D|nr:hypothetical protein [Phytobacter sp. MRY16-398]UKL15114.1 hypothetical protein [Elizabethkingia phage EKP1]BBE80239.1 hypothetical protein MRY16398_52950 [Phytobacter sp. MRY16-398]